MEPFRFDVELAVRYRDLDSMQHVNNAVYASYLEQARVQYVDRVLDVPSDELEMALASIEIEFHRQVTAEDGHVRVACGTVELGNSSLTLAYRVYPAGDDEPAATGETVQVFLDGDAPRPLPDAWREQFREFEPSL